MKYILFVSLFMATLLPNCKKEQIIIKTPDPTDTIVSIDTMHHIIGFGESVVLKNGILWNVPYATFYMGLLKKRFSIKGGNEYSNGLSEVSFITDIPLTLGKHSITMETSLSDFNNGIADAGYTMAVYDEGIGSFRPDTTRTDNFIEVLRFDTVTNEVEGRFQVFMGQWGAHSPVSFVPDSVFLTEGKFYLKLQ